jgi:hypothetical protein
MAFGGLVAATDRRYRLAVKAASPGAWPRRPIRSRDSGQPDVEVSVAVCGVRRAGVLFAFGLNPSRDIHALPSP